MIKIQDREQEVVFTNFTNKEFEGRWDFSNNKKIWKIKAGQSIYLPFYLAEHFAKHLVDRELNEKGLPTNHQSRGGLLNKCVDVYRQDQPADRAEVQYVNVKEVVLNRDRRAEEVLKEAPDAGVQINREALKQEEEFEGLEEEPKVEPKKPARRGRPKKK